MAFVIMKFVEGNSSEHGSRIYSAGINCVELKKHWHCFNSCCGF
jgi:hypothetical protein